jgi:hypothetical protein
MVIRFQQNETIVSIKCVKIIIFDGAKSDTIRESPCI